MDQKDIDYASGGRVPLAGGKRALEGLAKLLLDKRKAELVKKSKPTKKAQQLEWEQGKAEADADRWADEN